MSDETKGIVTEVVEKLLLALLVVFIFNASCVIVKDHSNYYKSKDSEHSHEGDDAPILDLKLDSIEIFHRENNKTIKEK